MLIRLVSCDALFLLSGCGEFCSQQPVMLCLANRIPTTFATWFKSSSAMVLHRVTDLVIRFILRFDVVRRSHRCVARCWLQGVYIVIPSSSVSRGIEILITRLSVELLNLYSKPECMPNWRSDTIWRCWLWGTGTRTLLELVRRQFLFVYHFRSGKW